MPLGSCLDCSTSQWEPIQSEALETFDNILARALVCAVARLFNLQSGAFNTLREKIVGPKPPPLHSASIEHRECAHVKEAGVCGSRRMKIWAFIADGSMVVVIYCLA